MVFKSLNHVLSSLEKQAGYQAWQQFQQLLQVWPSIVGEQVAAHTRPVGIYRHILQVATASSVWSQTLLFQRLQILEKLNAALPLHLIDIRFSTAQWHRPTDNNDPNAQPPEWTEHPCWIGQPPASNPQPPASNPQPPTPETAFAQWAQTQQQRSQHLPLCPQCHCPTPPGELQRWSVCSLCACKTWA